MAAYVIYQANVYDLAVYELYKEAAQETVTRAGGRYIVRGGASEVLEGTPSTARTVILEFPSMAVAKQWWESEGYEAARRLRRDIATADVLLVDGT